MTSIAISRTEHNQQGGIAFRLRAKAAGGSRNLMNAALAARGEPRQASADRLRKEAHAKTRERYRLRHRDGAYVNLDLSGETDNVHRAWVGTLTQLQNVRRRRPDLVEYRTITLPPQGKGGIIP
jgi:hypothetical protein